MGKKILHFLNDVDGISQKDFLLVVTSLLFFLPIIVGFGSLLIGHDLHDDFYELMGLIKPIMLAVVTGVFGIEGIEKFMKKDEWRG